MVKYILKLVTLKICAAISSASSPRQLHPENGEGTFW